MKSVLRSLVFLIPVLSSTQCATPPAACDARVRAVFDVGSGTSKLNLAKVNACGSSVTVIETLEEDFTIQLPLEVGKNSSGALTPEIQERGVAAIRELRDKAFAIAHAKAPGIKSIDFAVVGTQALRSATNSAEFADRLKALGLALVILPQEKEGEYGYNGAKSKGWPEICRSKDPLVWDVGGGSMQLTSISTNGMVTVHAIGIGAEGFKKKLVSELGSSRPRNCDFGGGITPNPIGWKNSSRAEKSAEALAQRSLPGGFQIHPASQCVIGIGGVHGKAIAAQADKLWPRIQSCACAPQAQCEHHANSYSKKELQCLALLLSEKSDCDPEIKGPYSTTSVSNLFLILGFMEAMKLDQVETMNVTMGTNLIQDSATLQWRSLPIPLQ